MAVVEIHSAESRRILLVDSRFTMRKKFKKFFNQANTYTLLLFLLAFISPVLWVMLAVWLFVKYNKLYERYFFGDAFYSTVKQFTKQGADTNNTDVFTVFGYEIEEDEWANHKRKLGGFSFPEGVNSLGHLQKALGGQERMINELANTAKNIRKNKPHKEFGIGIDNMFRHIAFSGTTGAGKTETLMSFFTDVLEVGGGIIMIDGKADMVMWQTLYRLAKEKGRETSSKVVNFLKSEKQPETNTYNPILTLPPDKAIDYIASLLPDVGGEGEYFKQRGISMMSPVMTTLRIRDQYYDEPASLSTLQDSAKPENFALQYALAYCIVKEENERLRHLVETNSKVRRFYEQIKDKTVAIDIEMEYYEKFLNYVLQIRPQAKHEVADIIGYDFMIFSSTYRKSYTAVKNYITEVQAKWFNMSHHLGQYMYAYLKDNNRNMLFTYQNFVKMEDMRRIYSMFKTDSTALEDIASRHEELASSLDDTKMALGHPVNGELPRESLVALATTPLQQHGYAQQQWTRFFDILGQFPNVFGSTRPDIEMKDILKNNGILYVLLPPLSLGKDTVAMLGKMFIRDIQIAASESLGGDKLDVEVEQTRILKDKITSKPINLAVFDEFGAYKVSGLDILLSQIRSIRISAILSVQDFVSLRTDGSAGESDQKRVLANCAKLILKTYDTESMEWAEKFIGKRLIEKTKTHKDEFGDTAKLIDAEIEESEVPIVDVKILPDMMYGCGIFIAGSQPTIVQSYYVGGKATGSFVTNLEPMAAA